MPPEVLTRVREIGIDTVRRTIDGHGRYIASADRKYRNPFLRDFVLSISQSFPQPGNQELLKWMLPPAIATMNLFLKFQSQFDIRQQRMPGEPPHEILDKFVPQKRLNELAADGWVKQTDSEGNDIIVTYEEDDGPSFIPIGAEVIVNAARQVYSEQYAQDLLDQWWGGIEAATLYDIYNSENGDHLIHTVPKTGRRIDFRMWRDGRGALKDRSGDLPQFPITFFANNCFRILGYEAEAHLASMRGLSGWENILLQKRELARQSLHEKFWMEDEQCFAMLVTGEGRKLEVVSNESAIGLYTGALYPEYAAKVAKTMLRDDLLTDYGTRVTSIYEPEHFEDEYETYQRKAVWPHMDTILVLGCLRYKLEDVMNAIIPRTAQYALRFGAREVILVDKDGNPSDYLEKGKSVASRYQAFVGHGLVGITGINTENAITLAA